MDYEFTSHARERMRERSIPMRLISDALHNPTTIAHDHQRILFKKKYKRKGQERLLLVAGEWERETLRIITVIDTSKVKKYL